MLNTLEEPLTGQGAGEVKRTSVLIACFGVCMVFALLTAVFNLELRL